MPCVSCHNDALPPVGGDQAEHEHGPLLADAVAAVHGLHRGRRVAKGLCAGVSGDAWAWILCAGVSGDAWA